MKVLAESLPCSVIVLRARSVVGGVHSVGGGVEDGDRVWEGEGDDGMERGEEPGTLAASVSYRGGQRKCIKASGSSRPLLSSCPSILKGKTIGYINGQN